ncbi:MAG: site-specific DNA-methyltransferase [Lachnospiraceae bacterium]|nr:site-specific DNA-methyltransferase [Lachnospiraceae bacterium]
MANTYTDAQKRADKRYVSKTDQLRIRIPKGEKAHIYAHAEMMQETIGQFVTRSLNETIKNDLASNGVGDNPIIDRKQIVTDILPQYTYDDGRVYCEDCLSFLKSLESASVNVVFADPPYNIGKADWDDLGSQDDYTNWSIEWIREASRILKPTGALFVCGFTEILADIRKPAMEYFEKCRWLIWYYDNKANMRNDWGRSHESIVCFRKSDAFTFNTDDVRIPYNAHTLKYPNRSQSGKTSQFFNEKNEKKEWTPNPKGAKPKDVINLPTTCNGMKEKTKHPTQKPEALIRKILLASTNEGDTVVDPFSGSGTTAVAASQLNRKFIVNDQCAEYNEWANDRILSIKNRGADYWIEYDKKTDERRRSIR